MYPKRPNAEELFEFVSIPKEMPAWKRFRVAMFVRFDSQTRCQVEKLSATWASYFQPEPNVTDSVMRVYARLRKDETLILKGFKLCEARPVVRERREFSLFQMAATTGVAAAVGAVVFWVGQAPRNPSMDLADNTEGGLRHVQMMSNPVTLKRQEPPMARIRFQDRNSIQVHYLQPELLQSIEFETTGTR